MAKEFAVPLRLVTPHMRGQKVRDAQWLLAGHNRFKDLATYKDGTIDGDYGAVSAQATRRAKYWLGYPQTALDGSFGQTIYEYLRPENWRPLPEAYRGRRDKRLAAAAASNPGARALEAARKEVGYHESPAGSNNNKFGVEYGFNRVPWCAIFESIMFKHTGTPRFRYAAVEAIYWDARANRNGLYIVRTPRAGDVIGYEFHGDRFAHTAFFVRFEDGGLRDLGGNTSVSNFSNGGEVGEQFRPLSLVSYYARVSSVSAR
jgi:hypothetical protein